jgi:transglutaminase-like putative cysteine protease
MFIRITHLTRYLYSQAVTFAPHAVYLRPRETTRQRLHSFELTISPAGRRVPTNDPLDNALDWVYFDDSRSNRLEFRSELLVETLDSNPFNFFLKPAAMSYPFAYDSAERTALLPTLAPRPDTPQRELRDWLEANLKSKPADTVAFITELNLAVHRGLRYSRRDEEGIQSVATTLSTGAGSCRDYAVFLMEICRMLGIAARFISGYLYEPPAGTSGSVAENAMHAWVEVFLPGAGWRALDPTRGIFCDDAFVPVAHAAVAESVNPIQGSFFGPAGVTAVLKTELAVEKL